MSEPKRVNFSAVIVHHIGGEKEAVLRMYFENDGMFVSYEDYTRLKAEVERLTLASQGAVKYVDHTMALTRQSMEHHKQVSRLEAQVERLTKAVMHSPAAQLKLKELEGKTTFEDINPKGGQP